MSINNNNEAYQHGYVQTYKLSFHQREFTEDNFGVVDQRREDKLETVFYKIA